MKVSQRPEAEETHLQAGPTETLWWNQNAMVYFMLCLNWIYIIGYNGAYWGYTDISHFQTQPYSKNTIKPYQGLTCRAQLQHWYVAMTAHFCHERWPTADTTERSLAHFWRCLRYCFWARFRKISPKMCIIFWRCVCIYESTDFFFARRKLFFGVIWQVQGLRIGVHRAVCLWTTSANGFPFSSWFTGTLPSLQIEVPVGIGDENSPAWAPRSE